MAANMNHPPVLSGKRRRLGVAIAASVAGVTLLIAPSAALAALPAPQQTIMASTTSMGAFATGMTFDAGVSDNGRFVVFSTDAANMPGATGNSQVYVKDLQTGSVELVSTPTGGSMGGNQASNRAVISGDGNWVAFVSTSTNLVAGFTVPMGTAQVYLRDLVNDVTTPVSRVSGMPMNAATTGGSGPLGISQDGGRVSFRSSSVLSLLATGLIVQGYVFDRAAGTNTVVTTTLGTTALATPALDLSLSHDGDTVAFVTATSGVVMAPPAGGFAQAYRRDITNLTALGATSMVSVNPAGSAGAGSDVDMVSVADNGAVAFSSTAGNLLSAVVPSLPEQIFYRPAGGPTSLVTHTTAGAAVPVGPMTAVQAPFISADGQHVAYTANSADLTALGSNMQPQAYVWDASDSSNEVVSVTPAGALGGNDSFAPRLTPSGEIVVFDSSATDIVPGVLTDGARQTYARGLAAVVPQPTDPGDPGAGDGSGSGSGSASSRNGGSLASTGSGADGPLVVSIVTGAALLALGAVGLVLYRVPRNRTVRD